MIFILIFFVCLINKCEMEMVDDIG